MTNVNSGNVFKKKKVWEDVVCPICKKKVDIQQEIDITFWEYPGTYSISKCGVCNIHFQSPRVKSNYVSIYYGDKEYWGCDLVCLSSDDNYIDRKSKKYDYIFKNIDLNKKGKVLDVGCGTGLLLSLFKKRGWDVKGIDTSEEIVKYANKTFKINAEVADLLSYVSDNKAFDMVTMTHVLEHVYDPLMNLKKVAKLLNKKGELILVIPNIDSIGYKVFKEKWFQFQPGRHLYYFNPSTISKLLEKAGFDVTEIAHTGWEDNYYSHFLSLKYKYSPKYEGNNNKYQNPREPMRKSLTYEIKKATASLFAGLLTILSFITLQSDVITVYAKKKN